MVPRYKNVKLQRGQTSCSDFAGLGWFLRSRLTSSGYAYFVLLNTSVRGPLLPPYAQVRKRTSSQAGSCAACSCSGALL